MYWTCPRSYPVSSILEGQCIWWSQLRWDQLVGSFACDFVHSSKPSINLDGPRRLSSSLSNQLLMPLCFWSFASGWSHSVMVRMNKFFISCFVVVQLFSSKRRCVLVWFPYWNWKIKLVEKFVIIEGVFFFDIIQYRSLWVTEIFKQFFHTMRIFVSVDDFTTLKSLSSEQNSMSLNIPTQPGKILISKQCCFHSVQNSCQIKYTILLNLHSWIVFAQVKV